MIYIQHRYLHRPRKDWVLVLGVLSDYSSHSLLMEKFMALNIEGLDQPSLGGFRLARHGVNENANRIGHIPWSDSKRSYIQSGYIHSICR